MSWKDSLPKENRYFETENGILYHANNMEILKQIADNVIDTVITDPPYGLKFVNLSSLTEGVSDRRREDEILSNL